MFMNLHKLDCYQPPKPQYVCVYVLGLGGVVFLK